MDRIKQFDPRSRNFSIEQKVGYRRRRSYTWRCWKVLDQGVEGACVGFGVGHELIARPAEVGAIDAKWCRSLYHEAQRIDPWPGGSYPGAKPQYEGTSVLAGVQIAHQRKWMKEYRWSFSFEEFVIGVGFNGPAVIGVDWWTGMMESDGAGFIHRSGHPAGGHCTLVNAVSVSDRTFTIHNSWGPNWGRKGEARIKWDDMEALLKDRGEACFFIHRRSRR